MEVKRTQNYHKFNNGAESSGVNNGGAESSGVASAAAHTYRQGVNLIHGADAMCRVIFTQVPAHRPLFAALATEL